MFFVISCVFSLSPADLLNAKQQNISILSYLANHFKTPVIAYFAPIIAFIAITKSFFGHYLGAIEGLYGFLLKVSKHTNFSMSRDSKLQRHLIELLMIAACWLTAIVNPSILGMIELFSGPVIAIILFLMPMYAIAKVPAMKKYSNRLQDSFTTLIGLLAILAIFYGLLKFI